MTRNYFDLFGLPVAYEINERELAHRHRELIAACHPDRYAQASAQERRLAVQTSATLNHAMKVLRDPIDRARYLLELAGVSTEDETSTSVDPLFLTQQMEWREALEEGRHDPQELARLTHELTEMRAAKEHELKGQLQAAAYLDARRLVRELQFLRRFGDELDEAHTEM